MALERLRLRLAVEVRSDSVFDVPAADREAYYRNRFVGSPLRIGERNEARAAVLALLLNDLHAAGGQPSLVARCWQSTTSSKSGSCSTIVSLLPTRPGGADRRSTAGARSAG